MADAQFIGVFPIGPEEFPCAVFYLADSARFLTVWLPPVEGARLLARINGWQPRRPAATDVLAEVLVDFTLGVESIELSSYHEGVYTATVELQDGSSVDIRPSDALALALQLDVPIAVDDSVVAAASFWMSAEDARDYFDFDPPIAEDEPGEQESESPTAVEFEEFMRNLGIADDDLGGDVESGADDPQE